jgi:carboxyl-terminal processing protease
VTFDRDMDQGMSWVGGPPLFPPVDETRKARWIDKRTCVLPVKLQEGAFYLLGINSPTHQNFRSKQGVAACTAAIYFSMKGATEEVEQRVRVPSIVSLEPENGAKEVDPGSTTLRVTFDVPMDEGISWTGGGTTFPKIPEGKTASWSDDGLTCTLPVALEPDHDYQLGLNSVTHKNFTSKWGVPLEEVVYKFRTRSAAGGGGGSSATSSISPAITKSQSRRALQALWDDMDRHYSYFTIKPQVDWNKLRDEYLAKVEACETRDQFLYELVQMLRALDDLHIWIDPGEEPIGTSGRGWRPAWNPSVVEQRLTGLQVIGHLARLASVEDSGYAYLEVTNLQAMPQEMDSLLAEMSEHRDAPGFIVDLRRCFGGSEPIAQQIAQFFCDREIVYAKNKYRDGPRHDQFGQELNRTLSPAKDPYTKPVVCLIANGTMSSGESFAQMLDALPHVVTVGERTRGASGNPAPFTLPGFDIKVWYSRWFDMGPDGSVVEGAGVSPGILIDRPPEAYQDADPIFAQALDVLRSRLGAD